jgi:hypothetical protein
MFGRKSDPKRLKVDAVLGQTSENLSDKMSLTTIIILRKTSIAEQITWM